MSKNKNIILFLGSAYNSNLDEVKNFEKSQKRKFRTAIITSHKINLNEKPPKQKGMEERFDFVLRCDTKNIENIVKVIKPIKNEVLIVFCYFESWMPLYARLVKLLPYVNMPTVKALKICNSKFEMRKKFIKLYPEITPKFMLVKDLEDYKVIAKKIKFPCITKPLNLTKSRLVIKSNNLEELKSNLKNTFKKIKSVYKKVHSESEPLVLAEEYMEGDVYSIDAYVNSKGKAYLTPIVKVVTGKDIGIDDFFNYYRLTPAVISLNEEKKAQAVARKAIKATGPTSITLHIELTKTKTGVWKIIELQTRPGGYRNEMLKFSYGIKHYENDFLNRMDKKPIISTKIISHTAVFEIFPEREGRLVSIKGIEKMKKLRSFVRYEQAKKIGEMCGFSRDGYIYVLQVVLNGRNRKVFEGDLNKMRDMIKIIVK
ncbi:MAG: ATP-grasp domain-containing protein [Candidatus Pacebacteria bacterium]|nr:ATP-grasp domain-containing protein [Candidatus Paceibacterota bacterium]